MRDINCLDNFIGVFAEREVLEKMVFNFTRRPHWYEYMLLSPLLLESISLFGSILF